MNTEIRQLTEYFSLLLTFAKGGEDARRFLLYAGTIRTLVDFYMSKTAQELVGFIVIIILK